MNELTLRLCDVARLVAGKSINMVRASQPSQSMRPAKVVARRKNDPPALPCAVSSDLRGDLEFRVPIPWEVSMKTSLVLAFALTVGSSSLRAVEPQRLHENLGQ